MLNTGDHAHLPPHQQIHLQLVDCPLDPQSHRAPETATKPWSLTVYQMGRLSELSLLFIIPVFPPHRAIVGILRCIHRRPPEKWRKGQFSPLLLQGCMQA